MIEPCLFAELAAKGWQRLGKTAARVYVASDGERFPTFERDGARLAISRSRSLSFHRGGVLVCDACDPAEVILRALMIDPDCRRQGKANAALSDLAACSDKLKTKVYLEPVPLENKGVAVGDLIALYQTHGFRLVDGANRKIMERSPVLPNDLSIS